MTRCQEVAVRAAAVDVHQHLWPEELVDRLRARSRPPYLRGWTLHTRGEGPYNVAPRGHDVVARIQADRDAGVGLACVSLSAPLGIERLDRPEADILLDAWHAGARALPDHFRAWASVPAQEDWRAGPSGSRSTAPQRVPGRAAACLRARHARGLGTSRRGAARRRAGRAACLRPSRRRTRTPRRPRPGAFALVVGPGRWLCRADAGCLVGLAGRWRAGDVPVAAAALRSGRGTGADPP